MPFSRSTCGNNRFSVSMLRVKKFVLNQQSFKALSVACLLQSIYVLAQINKAFVNFVVEELKIEEKTFEVTCVLVDGR